MKKNSKGFTMIEIIGAVIILGVLVGFLVPNISRMLKQFRINYYEKIERTTNESGKDFFADNKIYKPDGLLKTSYVNASTLINQKYIDNLLDYKGKSCSLGEGESYTLAIYMGDGKYKYHTCIKCADDDYLSDQSGTYCDPAWLTNDNLQYDYGNGGNVYFYYGTSREEVREKLLNSLNIVKYNDNGEELERVKILKTEDEGILPNNIDIIETKVDLGSDNKYEYALVYGNEVDNTKMNLTAVIYKHSAPKVTMTTDNGDIYESGTWVNQGVIVELNEGDDFFENLRTSIAEYQWKINDGEWEPVNCLMTAYGTYDGTYSCFISLKADSLNNRYKFRILTSEGKITEVTDEYVVRIDQIPPSYNPTNRETYITGKVIDDGGSGVRRILSYFSGNCHEITEYYYDSSVQKYLQQNCTTCIDGTLLNPNSLGNYNYGLCPNFETAKKSSTGYYEEFQNTNEVSYVMTYENSYGNPNDDRAGVATFIQDFAGNEFYFEGSMNNPNYGKIEEPDTGDGSDTGTDDDITPPKIEPDTDCTIKYNAQGGMGLSIEEQTVTCGTEITLPSGLTKEGYNFWGWYTSSTGGTYLGYLNYTVEEDITVYAQWGANTKYKFLLDPNGGIINGSSSSVSLAVAKNTLINLSNYTVTRKGYSFQGWCKNVGGTGCISGSSYEVVEDVTLYAIWEPHTYTIKYNANGGTGSTSSSSCTYGVDCSVAKNKFTKTGYIFDGWSYNGVTYSEGAKVKNLTTTDNGSVTFTANWKEEEVVKSICELYTDTQLFGTSKGTLSGNYGSWITYNSYFDCYMGGTTCQRKGGYERVCASDYCGKYKGKTAEYIRNNVSGCENLAKLWCSCAVDGSGF